MLNHKKANKPRTFTTSWIIIVCASLSYALQYLVRVSTNMLTQELMVSLSIDATGLSILSSIYFTSYLMVLIPVGLLLDCLGPRPVFALCGACFSSGSMLFAISTNFETAALARALMGIGGSCGFIGTIKVGSILLPRNKLSYVIAITITFGTLGAIAGGSPIVYLNTCFGWRRILFGLGLICALLSLFLYGIIPVQKSRTLVIPGLMQRLLRICSSKSLWVFSLYGSITIVPIILLGDLCGKDFLEKHPFITNSFVPPIIACMFLGMSTGSPTFTLLSNIMRQRRFPLIASTFCFLSSCVILIFFIDISTYPAMLLFFSIGFFYGGKSVGFTSFLEEFPAEISGLAISIANAIITSGPAILLPLFGFILDSSYSGHETSNLTMSSYSIEDFQLAFLMVPTTLLTSLIILLFQKETFPDSTEVRPL